MWEHVGNLLQVGKLPTCRHHSVRRLEAGREGGHLRQPVESFRPACAAAEARRVRLLPVDDSPSAKGGKGTSRNTLDLQEVAADCGQLRSVADRVGEGTRTPDIQI